MVRKINISKLLSDIDSFGKDAKREAVAITNVVADKIVADAKVILTNNKSVNYGQLRSSIGNTEAEIGNNRSIIFANTYYAPYVEFGTGGRTSVPKGFEQLAAQFKGKKTGNFDQMLEAIRDWCKRKGIDEKAAYIISIRILQRGLTPQPFLIPAYMSGVYQYSKKLEKALEKQTQKYNAKK